MTRQPGKRATLVPIKAPHPQDLKAWVDAYAAWIDKLRAGKAAEGPPLDDDNPLANLGRKLQLLEETLQRREEQFQQLFDLVENLEKGFTIQNVLNRIFDGFSGLIPYDRIGCAFLSDDGSRVTAFWVRSNLGSAQISAGYSQPMAGNSLEQVLQTRQPRIINDLEEYLKSKPGSDPTRRIVLEGGRSNLTCPLIIENRPIGFLFFTSKEKNTYKDVHKAAFHQIASHVSIVIDQSRTYQKIVEHNLQLTKDSEKFEAAANHDHLTGILNRGAIIAVLGRTMTERRQSGKSVGVIMADIDHFKRINDTLGHPAGDAALVEFTRRITTSLRTGDQLGRYGGEEFLIVAPGTTREAVKNVAERLRGKITASPFKFGDKKRDITASFGAAISTDINDTVDNVIAAADRALYTAKSTGRNRVVVA
jgi:diguanylate cyclase (GGDEF)-like protein